MDVIKSHDVQIPENEAALIALLAQCENRIDHLRAQMDRELMLKSSLVQKLEKIQQKPPAVNILPVELLVQIFAEFISESTIDIGKLLLVCTRWYEVIIKTPSLWSRITIRPTWGVHEAPLLLHYVECALRRSQDNLLDVSINLNHYCLPESVFEALAKSVSGPEEDRESIDWLLRGDHYRSFPIITNRVATYSKVFELLAGEDGEVLSRWRSVSLLCSFGHDEDEDILLSGFFRKARFPAPNLTTINMGPIHSPFRLNKCFPGVSALRRLCVGECTGTTFAENKNPEALQELRTGHWHLGITPKQLATFTSLRLLFLGPVWFQRSASDAIPPFTLPLLEEFHVISREPEKERALQFVLRAPALRVLGFRWTSPTPYPTFYQVETLMAISDAQQTVQFLETELPRFKNLKRLILSQRTGNEVIQWIEKNKDVNPGLRQLSSIDIPTGVPSSGLSGEVNWEWNFVDEFTYRTHEFR